MCFKSADGHLRARFVQHILHTHTHIYMLAFISTRRPGDTQTFSLNPIPAYYKYICIDLFLPRKVDLFMKKFTMRKAHSTLHRHFRRESGCHTQ